MKKQTKIIGSLIILLAVGFLGWFVIKENKSPVSETPQFTYADEKPFIPAWDGCKWGKTYLEKNNVQVFLMDCPKNKFNENDEKIFETAEGNITIQYDRGNVREKAIEVFTKDSQATPLSIIEKEFSKLTSVQQKICTISSNVENTNFDAKFNRLYTVPHKTRYQIEPAKEWVKSMGGENELIDNIHPCGEENSNLYATGHYYEFDDRSPERYIKINLLNNDEGPIIDLNSIRF